MTRILILLIALTLAATAAQADIAIEKDDTFPLTATLSTKHENQGPWRIVMLDRDDDLITATLYITSVKAMGFDKTKNGVFTIDGTNYPAKLINSKRNVLTDYSLAAAQFDLSPLTDKFVAANKVTVTCFFTTGMVVTWDMPPEILEEWRVIFLLPEGGNRNIKKAPGAAKEPPKPAPAPATKQDQQKPASPPKIQQTPPAAPAAPQASSPPATAPAPPAAQPAAQPAAPLATPPAVSPVPSPARMPTLTPRPAVPAAAQQTAPPAPHVEQAPVAASGTKDQDEDSAGKEETPVPPSPAAGAPHTSPPAPKPATPTTTPPTLPAKPQ